MRLKLSLDRSIRTQVTRAYVGDKWLYPVGDEVKSVRDLAKKIVKDLGLDVEAESLHFSLDGYAVLLTARPCEIFREDDVVFIRKVKITGGMNQIGLKPLAIGMGVQQKKGMKRPASTSLEEIDTSTKSSKGQVPGNSSTSTSESEEESSSTSDESSVEESEDSSMEVSSDSEKKSGAVVIDKKKESSSTSEESSVEESEDSSMEVSSESEKKSGAVVIEKKKESSSSSEESSVEESEESSMESSSDSDSSGDTSNVVGLATKESKEQSFTFPKLGERKPDAWKKLERNPLKGDVLGYKILEVGTGWTPEVTDWRCGCVVEYCPGTRLLTLAPWPDRAVHPDPKIQNQKTQPDDSNDSNEYNEDDDVNGKKILEVPQSEYAENGQLVKCLDDFVELRLIQSSLPYPNAPLPQTPATHSFQNQLNSSTLASTPGTVKTPVSNSAKRNQRRKRRKLEKNVDVRMNENLNVNGVSTVENGNVDEWGDVQKILEHKKSELLSGSKSACSVKGGEQGSNTGKGRQRRHSSGGVAGILAYIKESEESH